ncbi:MAG TPA: hypothetical protein VFT66_06260 [Roseiflexaceae bacterium]|nr:hypothetical protein [Roseiflexaceae bacterium]
MWALDALLAIGRAPFHLTADQRATAFLLDGFHGVESDKGVAFRWTAGESHVRISETGAGEQLLILDLGAPPPVPSASTFTIQLGEERSATLPVGTQPRRYMLLVPPDVFRFGMLTVGMSSNTVSVPPDPRAVGLRFQSATLRTVGQSWTWPAWALFGAQVLLLALAAALLWRVGIPPLWIGVTLALGALALALLYAQQLLIAQPYVLRFCVAMAMLVALTFWLLPHAERALGWVGARPMIRAVWGITALACVIRLAGALFPLFTGYDLGLNTDRLIKVLSGMLVITRPSIEFRNGITVYPPGPYLAFLPALLLGLKPFMVVQGCIALFDGLATLPTALLARRLGASPRATLFVALLYAAIPVNLTALWFGLTAQVFGQALMMPLALALLSAMERSDWRMWLVAGALLLMALLSHIGVAILAVAWLGLVWLLLRLRRTVSVQTWWRMTAVGAASCLISVLLIYADVAALHVEQALAVGEKVASREYTPAYNLILRGFQIAFSELGFVLLVPALVLLRYRRLPRGSGELIGAALVTMTIFWAIEMYSGLQVRYMYFLTPIACLAIATALDALSTRGTIARYLAWLVVVFIVGQSSAAWLYSAFADMQMSMVSLLR